MTKPFQADAFVFFGATGYLAYKMIFPALQAMVRSGRLDVPLFGVAKAWWKLDDLRERARKSLIEHEGYVGKHSLKHRGKRKWRKHVADVVERLTIAFEPGYVVIGGGNAKKLDHLPGSARRGKNADAFTGGFRMWPTESPEPQALAATTYLDLSRWVASHDRPLTARAQAPVPAHEAIRVRNS